VLEVNKADIDVLRSRTETAGVVLTVIGTTTEKPTCTISSGSTQLIDLAFPTMHVKWSESLERALGSL
jgi:type 1 fimbria pilin